MKIGYPCINLSLGCRTNRSFRLKSYSRGRIEAAAGENLDCLLSVLQYNLENGILFFRITSDIIPFASHPVCEFEWQEHFADKFREIGAFIKNHGIRISMHPDQFTVINSPDNDVFLRSEKELAYHAKVLDLMELPASEKIQVHAGGVYGDKKTSAERFMLRYRSLDRSIRRRLVIENDDRCYSIRDVLAISGKTGAPVLFDWFHHSLNPSPGELHGLLGEVSGTWKPADGVPMADYSFQEKGKRPGQHARTINMGDFLGFIEKLDDYDFDVMLEIKDKEKSALKALRAVKGLTPGRNRIMR